MISQGGGIRHFMTLCDKGRRGLEILNSPSYLVQRREHNSNPSWGIATQAGIKNNFIFWFKEGGCNKPRESKIDRTHHLIRWRPHLKLLSLSYQKLRLWLRLSQRSASLVPSPSSSSLSYVVFVRSVAAFVLSFVLLFVSFAQRF